MDVSTSSELYQALNAVVPGETIQLAPGTYSGEYTLTVSGTAAAPITLTGPSTAVITGESGANSADAWVDAKGNDYTVTDNTGVDAYQDGCIFIIEQLAAGFGCGNTFADTSLNLGSATGYGFDVRDQSDCAGAPNIVYASNIVAGGAGVSNIAVTQGD